MWEKFLFDFHRNFIEDDRWKWLTDGLMNTLLITFFAAILGIAIGFVVAIVRSTYDKAKLSERRPGPFMWLLNAICQVYITVVRGTPVVVQLMITYYIIFASWNNKLLVAVLAFGLNSGAYVAEIVRGGIESIDQGQMEAGRSLGLSFGTTMTKIIIPQAFRNSLPSLCNEFISLLKETSVAGYIAIEDLSKGGDIIRSITYDPYLPLFAVALIYLVIVMLLSYLVRKLEGRLQHGR
ncbi:MAG: amino acid ABC transporter permease [Oscillospiraceae bacterium]|nr:amino acid ABC transporter permease [Oscillospiraceae bacterium]